jgi:hypothetical protein
VLKHVKRKRSWMKVFKPLFDWHGVRDVATFSSEPHHAERDGYFG